MSPTHNILPPLAVGSADKLLVHHLFKRAERGFFIDMARKLECPPVGFKKNRLTFVSFAGIEKHNQMGVWICDCGETIIKAISRVLRGDVGSCGCWKTDVARQKKGAKPTHGMSNTTEYRSYNMMKVRCLLPSSAAYKNYGGRGITICEQWLRKGGFAVFLADMGMKPTAQHSIERLDNNGNYDPANCVWASPFQQCRNRRNLVMITLDGITRCKRDFARFLGISENSVRSYLRAGMTAEQIRERTIKRKSRKC